MIDLMLGDCLERMKELDDNSVDSIVTDPPYGLSFMGKHWDKGVPSAEIWAEALRVLKPGGHLLAFAGTRTQHRMAVNIEDAGFEIRDMIAWVYGSGFPKSLDVSKAIDKAAGVEREPGMPGRYAARRPRAEVKAVSAYRDGIGNASTALITAPATEAAKLWDGWGTALKPALEPITVARKPFKGTVAANVQEHGTGAINIDGCRVGDFQNTTPSGVDRRNAKLAELGYRPSEYQMGEKVPDTPAGRWPANLIHDGSDEVVGLFPNTKSGAINPSKHIHKNGKGNSLSGSKDGSLNNYLPHQIYAADKGSAARFFYCAKASKKDRGADNKHPTVKPTELMRYLCRLVTPPNGTVLDPFMGSGSTGKAAVLEGFSFVGIELESESFDIAKQRINEALNDR